VVALGVAVATAVITGSLVVGDSVTDSVRDTALVRLGHIDHALTGPVFFRDDLAAAAQLKKPGRRVVPAIITTGAARNPDTGVVVPGVDVIGIGDDFRELFEGDQPRLSGREVAVNEVLARDLGVGPGEYVLINAGRRAEAPADTLFARRDRKDVLGSMRLKVVAVLPDFGAGGFSLGSRTSLPRNAFISKEWLGDALGRQGRSNALLVRSSKSARDENEKLQSALARACTPVDYGLKLVPNDEQGYLSVESETLVLPDGHVHAIRRAAEQCGAHPAATSVYLADSISKAGGEGISYAVIAGMEPHGPPDSSEISDTGILLNTWAAKDLNAEVGDELEVAYLVGSRDGTYRTESGRFTVSGIVELEGAAADPGLVPDFEGITEAKSITDWDPPFPLDLKRVTDRDEEYWNRYQATPKAFLQPQAARSIWNSGRPAGRGGWVTSMRLYPAEGATLGELEKAFAAALKENLSPAEAGLAFRPVRLQALKASKGTQDYGVLFISMSMFLVLAAMGLAGMLIRLSAQQRAAEAGALLACGFTSRAAMLSVAAEGAALSVFGVIMGVPLGVAYARGIIYLLGTGRLGSIGDASLWLHVNAGSLAIGTLCGLAAGIVSVWWGARGLGRSKVLDLLAGRQAMSALPSSKRHPFAAALLLVSLVAAGALAVAVRGTGAFFGSGAVLLIAALCACYLALARALAAGGASMTMRTLTVRSAAANRGRSMLTVGLLACAVFVIVATAANTRDYSQSDAGRLDSGTGGFSLRAVSSIPIPYDFGTKTGREKLGFPPKDEALFEGVNVFSFLSNSGDDISCLNLAKPMFPRVLGVGTAMIERAGFRLSASGAVSNSPWDRLEQAGEDDTIPVFGDADSVRWQLHSGLGEVIKMPTPGGEPVELRVAGTIAGSVFAGELLMSESDFKRTFRGDDAPRYFLIETPSGTDARVAEALRRNLGDMGLEVRSTREILNAVVSVQNTYISTFVALGGLGVVLGTFGLVIVLLRSALERRGEFALMLATGFSRKFLSRLLVAENAGLLCAGLLCGAVSALLAVAPQISSAQSRINWPALAALLTAIVLIGLASCAVAARAAVRGNLIEALREE